MASVSSLTAQPLAQGNDLNWIWLVELLVCGILVIFFLFYFNRLFATLLSYGLRAYTWRKYKVFVDIQALQISLLGGRIFFKGVRYHGKNETVLVQSGYLTWNYWLRSVRQVDCKRFRRKDREGHRDNGIGQKENVSDTTSIADGLEQETGGIDEPKELPCRISIFAQGVEWIAYNRSPAYDAIISSTSQRSDMDNAYVSSTDASGLQAPQTPVVRHGSKLRKSQRPISDLKFSTQRVGSSSEKASSEKSSNAKKFANSFGQSISNPDETDSLANSLNVTSQNGQIPSLPTALSLLPISLDCQKGALVLGNENTKVILTTVFDRVKGRIDASTSGPLDLYKQLFEFEVIHPVVQFKPNPDFKDSQEDKAEQLEAGKVIESRRQKPKSWNWSMLRWGRKLVNGLRDMVPRPHPSAESFRSSPSRWNERESIFEAFEPHVDEAPWLGLDRYLDEETRNEHAGWNSVEYARYSTLVDCPSINFTFYWDVPGLKTLSLTSKNDEDDTLKPPAHDINGAEPPAYGLKVLLRGGTINYGPWADRARAEIQNVFFPNPYTSVEPAESLVLGSLRQSTVFKIDIEVGSETVLRIPTREGSKDWQWRGRANAIRNASKLRQRSNKKHSRHDRGDQGVIGPDIRPFGWLSLYLSSDSMVTFEMDMISRQTGYKNMLKFDIRKTKMTSSVNHDLLWQSETITGQCDLSNPLSWNAPHKWTFDITTNSLQMFILRDHMFLLTDLISDWGSSAPADFWTFVPFRYSLRLAFNDLKLYLNANDSNIINNPSDLDDNTFLVIAGHRLDSTVEIPLEKYRPTQNRVTFIADLKDAYLKLITPLWSTHRSFLNDHSVATLKHFALDGAFNYNVSTSPSLTDSLTLDLSGQSPKIFLHGFLIRHFISIKDNYFGENIHFRTLEEFQHVLRSRNESMHDNTDAMSTKKENDLDVLLTVHAHDASILLPSNLYTRKDNVKLDLLLVESDMRFNNYYSDISANFHTLEASLESVSTEDLGSHGTVSNVQLFVDGTTIYGHRLFGTGPTEPTYVCNWDFEIGNILGECSSIFLRTLMLGIRSFVFSLEDDENALPISSVTTIRDITFLRAEVGAVRLYFLTDEMALLFSSSGISLDFSDRAENFSAYLNVDIPEVVFAAVDRRAAARHRDIDVVPAMTHAYLTTSIGLEMVSRKSKNSEDGALQLNYVSFHDQRSHRVPWLSKSSNIHENQSKSTRNQQTPPTMPLPSIPSPIQSRSDSVSRRKDNRFRSTELRRSPRSRLSTYHKTSEQQGVITESSSARRSLPTTNHSLSGITFSSPWLPPHFVSLRVEPDQSELPSALKARDEEPAEAEENANDIDFYTNSLDQHSGLLCCLRDGIRGFFKPDFVSALTKLQDDLQPRHPADILDDLQIRTMSRILGAADAKSKPGVVFDLLLRIPSSQLRFINTYHLLRANASVEERDRYDCVAENTHIKIRNRKQTVETAEMNHKLGDLVMHMLSKRMSITVSERGSDRQRDKAALQGVITDVTFWLSKGAELNAKTQVKTVDLVTWGAKVEYLAALIHRTAEIIDSTMQNVELIASEQTNRTRHLVYQLAESGRQLPDPVFLTRPSYVLRAANDHLRANDSWKIISRLRFIYRNIAKHQQEELISQCSSTIPKCPYNAKDDVLSNFDQWRTWDLAHVRNSEIMKFIWGLDSLNEISPPYPRAPMLLALTVGHIRLLLDPGPKQSEFVLADLNSNACFKYQYDRLDSHDRASINHTEVISIQAYCSDCALRLNWEVVELVDDTIAQFHDKPKSAQNFRKQSEPPYRVTHVVVGMDLAAVTLDSINLQVALESKDLKGSFIQTNGALSSNLDPEMNIITSSSLASTEIRSLAKTLMTWSIFQPNIFGSVTKARNPGTERAFRISGSCQQLFFELKEEILGVLEVLQCVISDEVDAIRTIFGRKVPVSQDRPPSQPSSLSQRSGLCIHAAFFLDNYSLRAPILPSLVYSFHGKVARTAIRPQFSSGMRIDVDIKEQRHRIRSGKTHVLEPSSSLEIPPINASALIRQIRDPVSVAIEAMVEKIQLDGGAFRAWIDRTIKPDVTRVFHDIQRAIRKIRSQVNDVFSLSPIPVAVEPEKQSSLVYDANIAFSGLSIQTSAPAINDRGYMAELILELGLVSAHIHNKDARITAIFERPQLSLILGQISLSLSRQSGFQHANFGELAMGLSVNCTTETYNENTVQSYRVTTDALAVKLYAETAALVVDVAEHLQERIRALDLSPEVKQLSSIRRMTRHDLRDRNTSSAKTESESETSTSNILFASIFSVALSNVQIIWIINDMSAISPGRRLEDLVFNVRNIDLKTQQANAARLTIEDLQMQMVPKGDESSPRSLNSALLPEMVFNVAYISSRGNRRLAFQAAGKGLDLRLTSDFIIPANIIQSSLATASKELRKAKTFQALNASENEDKKPLFGGKRLASLLVDVDFAGAVVTMQARPEDEAPKSAFSILKGPKRSKANRYGKIFQSTSGSKAILRAPGVAFKVEYKDLGDEDPSLNAEIKVAASSNILYPSVVPLILEISSGVKEVMGDTDAKSIASETIQSQKLIHDSMPSVDPGLFGSCKVNVGVWIQSQEFGLSCQPIARVAATARFDDIMMTVNTIQAPEQERFFALLLSFNSLHVSVQHVYSRESTANFDVKSIIISLMNSKHVSSVTGLSAILRISPVQTSINAKQLQDFLLFREIWYPAEIRRAPTGPAPPTTPEFQPYVVQRYQQVAAAGAFPWNTVVAIEELNVQLDLGQSLGRSAFTIQNLWASSRKSSDWEQNLCIGFEDVGLESTGRMSGIVELQRFKIRTSIKWPSCDNEFRQRPLIQASLGFAELRVKGSFDYQPFIIADITSFNFLMYNVREPGDDRNDRLVAILDGDKVQIFCTTTSASQGFALYQAVERLKQEKQAAYESSLRELEKHLHRKSIYPSGGPAATIPVISTPDAPSPPKAPLSLHTDVVVTLQALKVGAFPSTFFDSSIFKVEAYEAQARFAVSVANNRIHSGLSLRLGQLRVALSGVNRSNTTALGEVAIDDVVDRATGSRGGTILKVPRVVATMQTWQTTPSNHIDYIFRSSFEGKVDVGWNYSRISFIRGMWSTHSRALSQRLGKPLTQSAVQITGAPPPSSSSAEPSLSQAKDQEKITAVVNVPQSRFEYTALESPVIETPQLRDMGEATPPLEWIGLQRERLPNLTHQIIIVGLLEVCREVEEAYGRILGNN